MKTTMPRYKVRAMRFLLERLIHWISRVQERQGGELTDYRLRYALTGVMQAHESVSEILAGKYNPMLKQEGMGTVGKVWMVPARIGDRYADELLRNVPIPMELTDEALSTSRQS